MKRLLALVSLLNSLSAFAYTDDDIVGRWDAHCSHVGSLSGISAKSASGQPVNDDMDIALVWSSGDRTRLSLPGAWYLKRTDLSQASSSPCEGVALLEISTELAMVAVAFDGRPGGDHIAIALVDLRHRRVLDTIPDLGEVPDHHRLAARTNTWVFPIATSSRPTRDGGEETIYRKRSVGVNRGHLYSEWER
jgi:hypothetical protein